MNIYTHNEQEWVPREPQPEMVEDGELYICSICGNVHRAYASFQRTSETVLERLYRDAAGQGFVAQRDEGGNEKRVYRIPMHTHWLGIETGNVYLSGLHEMTANAVLILKPYVAPVASIPFGGVALCHACGNIRPIKNGKCEECSKPPKPRYIVFVEEGEPRKMYYGDVSLNHDGTLTNWVVDTYDEYQPIRRLSDEEAQELWTAKEEVATWKEEYTKALSAIAPVNNMKLPAGWLGRSLFECAADLIKMQNDELTASRAENQTLRDRAEKAEAALADQDAELLARFYCALLTNPHTTPEGNVEVAARCVAAYRAELAKMRGAEGGE